MKYVASQAKVKIITIAIIINKFIERFLICAWRKRLASMTFPAEIMLDKT